MEVIMYSLFIALGGSISLLIVLALISTYQKKKKGQYDDLDQYKDRKDRKNSKALTRQVTEKKITVWQMFRSWAEYFERRRSYEKDRKKLAHHAASLTDYKKRSKAFKQMAKDSFKYTWAGPQHLIPQN